MNQNENLPKLSNNTRNYVHNSAFENDKLERKILAKKLTNYLDRLKDGAVLAIDAPWGEGKTWFGKNWNKSLQNQGYKTIYIDTFEQDYIEDSFMLISSEILYILKKKNQKFETLKKSGAEVAKALLPIGTKVLLNLGSRALLGSSDIPDTLKKAIKDSSDATNQLATEWINNKLENYTNNKRTMYGFKKQLREYVAEEEKPIIIFIDELDRCKPTFAVNLIERIKHFFDIQNIVFILLLNREQLESAIKGIYGMDTDAVKYLDKFINFYFKFPEIESVVKKEQQIKNFISFTMSKYNFQKEEQTEYFKNWIFYWIIAFDLSLRDIEKCIALYAFTYPNEYSYILPYFLALKIKKKDLFERLFKNEKEAHSEAMQLLDNLKERAKTETILSSHILDLFREWHEAHFTDFHTLGKNFKSMYDNNKLWGIDKGDLFKYFAKKIDLDIE